MSFKDDIGDDIEDNEILVLPHEEKVKSQSYDMMRAPIYTGEELSRQSQRPGAYDAFNHPSLDAGGNRRPYRYQ